MASVLASVPIYQPLRGHRHAPSSYRVLRVPYLPLHASGFHPPITCRHGEAFMPHRSTATPHLPRLAPGCAPATAEPPAATPGSAGRAVPPVAESARRPRLSMNRHGGEMTASGIKEGRKQHVRRVSWVGKAERGTTVQPLAHGSPVIFLNHRHGPSVPVPVIVSPGLPSLSGTNMYCFQ